ncbi:MAG: hypothetical protein BMS9Abin12_0757 [Acidimicrobiia bacterium]|nr:MAG: hypothetical protein BMS9Abin12_0757 [Acidimicrobiia bacterium]
MKIDDFINQNADETRSAYAHRVPPLSEPRRAAGIWVALGAAVLVLILSIPVVALVRLSAGDGSKPPASQTTDSRTVDTSASIDEPGIAVAGGRCTDEIDTFTLDGQGFFSFDDALAAAAQEAGLDASALRREGTSDTWIAGSSNDPESVVDLRQPDGSTEWFVVSIRTCSGEGEMVRTTPGGSFGELTALPSVVLVDGADVGDIYTTAFAADSSGFATMWQEFGLIGQVPDVDFETQVVFYFGAVESSGCPLGAVAGLMYNTVNQSVYPDIPVVAPEGSTTCNEDANRHAVLIAVERDDLPGGAFSLWISADDPPGCCVDGMTFIAAGELTAPAGASYAPLGADGELAIGETRIAYAVFTHCGVEWLGRSVNGQWWRAIDLQSADATGIDPVPLAWGKANDSLDLVLTLVDSDTLEVTTLNSDVTVAYTPDPDAPGCA